MHVRIPRAVVLTLRNKYNGSQIRNFWERDRKGGYPIIRSGDEPNQSSNLWHIRNGLGLLGNELKLFKEEIKERFENDPLLICRQHEIDVVWRFNGDKKILDDWIVTADSDYGEGYSKCSLQLTKSGRGLFSGYLDKRVPKTGVVKKAGYCNVKTVRAQKSFKRESFYDWHNYNHLVMRVRGDGRSYMLNLSIAGYFDLTWHDAYNYVLYTRGGPYWQYVKIPFSKFFFSSKGRVQDSQEPIALENIVNFGITAGDKVTGTFSLEIDYIGLLYDENHTEEFAYETYETKNFIAGH